MAISVSNEISNPLPPRFWRKVIKRHGGCWVWTASRDTSGYGHFRIGGTTFRSHRLAYQETKGQIPPGKILRHTCDVRHCVNPEHLILGDHQQNCQDRIVRSRSAPVDGEKNPNRKLTATQVAEIRHRYSPGVLGETDLAKQYGISRSQVGNILRHERWKNV